MKIDSCFLSFSYIDVDMKCMEACVYHGCKSFWIEEADLEKTELNEGDFSLEEKTFE